MTNKNYSKIYLTDTERDSERITREKEKERGRLPNKL